MESIRSFSRWRLVPVLLSALALAGVFSGCDSLNDLNDELFQSERERDQEEVLNNMKHYYYWYQEIPDIHSSDYSSVPDLFNACLWTPERGGRDKWSFILTQDEYKSWVEEGTVEAYGVTFVRYVNTLSAQTEIRVGMVYSGSHFESAGIRRGFRLDALNGVSAADFLSGDSSLDAEMEKASGSFVFTDLTGSQVTKSVTRGVVTIHPAAQWGVFERAGKKVGYLMFTSFMVTDNEKEIVQEVFDSFDQAGINDLILDLRYNGGGNLTYTRDFAGYVVPTSARDDVFMRLFYNDKVDGSYNTTYRIKIASPALSLPRVAVITSPNTASASESLIMGLSPYMNVVTIGTTTHGKPVGMNGYSVPGNVLLLSSARWVMLPITFVTRNKLGEGEYYDGLAPDFTCADDVLHPFDENEKCIKAALDYFDAGSFPEVGALRGVGDMDHSVPLMYGFSSQIGFH